MCLTYFIGGLQMEHVDRNGLRHHDTIFPLFLYKKNIFLRV